MIIAIIQILLGLTNTALIVRLSNDISESDLYILSNTIIGFVVAIIYSYVNTKWIAQLRKKSDSKKNYTRIQKIFYLETIISSATGLIIGLTVFLIFKGLLGHYSTLWIFLTISAACITIFVSTLINCNAIEKRVNSKINEAEYPGALVQGLLLISLILFKPGRASEVLMFTMGAHVMAMLIFIKFNQYLIVYDTRYVISYNLKRNALKFLRVILSASIFKSSPLVDRSLASSLNYGDVTSLGIASTIVSGLSILYEKSIGIRHVINTIDNVKNKKKPEIIPKLIIYSLMLAFVVVIAYAIESNSRSFSKIISNVFNLNSNYAEKTYSLLTIILLTLPFQLLGPSISAIHQYYRNEHFPMYLGALGIGISAIFKYLLYKNYGITIIPVISLIIAILLFFINYQQSRKLHV